MQQLGLQIIVIFVRGHVLFLFPFFFRCFLSIYAKSFDKKCLKNILKNRLSFKKMKI